MWELFIAIAGFAYLSLRIRSDKSKQSRARHDFDKKQSSLSEFRTAVTNDRMVSAVEEYMCSADANENVPLELKELFERIPELRGREMQWSAHNHKPPASNWDFIKLILCFKRKCVPVTKQFSFSIHPYYIGNNSMGVPKYVSLSTDSCEVFAEWSTEQFRRYGINVSLVFKPQNGEQRFIWCV